MLVPGTQERPPQNIPQLHVNYFKLKLLDKQTVPEGYLGPPLSFQMQEIPHVKVVFPTPGTHQLSDSRKVGINKSCCLFYH